MNIAIATTYPKQKKTYFDTMGGKIHILRKLGFILIKFVLQLPIHKTSLIISLSNNGVYALQGDFGLFMLLKH